MNLGKLTLSTLAFVLFTELITVWVFLDFWFNIESFIDKYSLLVNGSIELAFVATFIVFLDGLRGIRPAPTSKKFYLIALLAGLAIVLLQYPLYKLYNIIFGTDVEIILDFDFVRLKTIDVLPVIIFIPLAEELFFRQFIQKRLQRNFNAVNSIFLSALLFSVVHINFISAIFLEYSRLSFETAYIALFGGIISGILYFKSKSIGPSIIFHMMWNFVAVAS